MGSNVSSVVGILAPGQAANALSGTKEENAAVPFADLMSKMAPHPGGAFDCGGGRADSGRAGERTEPAAGADSYKQYQYRENTVQKQSEAAGAVEEEQCKERLDSYEEEVKDVLKEALGVTEEQIREAMEQLGLTAVDLMDPRQLADLVSVLTGCGDAGQLLCSGEFLNVLKEVSVLTEELLQDLGLTAEEVKQMFQMPADTAADMPADTAADMPAEDAAVLEEIPVREPLGQDAAEDAVRVSSQAEPSRNAAGEEQGARETVSALTEQDAGKAAERAEDAAGEELDGKGLPKESGLTPEKAGTSEQQAGSGLNQHSHAAEAGNVPQQQAGNVQAAGEAPEFARQIDVENIIRQITEYTKIHVSSRQTTLEMQLNPENLGKLYLEVTAKQGNVSAHIIAQNELVKEALEAQIVELKQNMNQAGVKVDAVEVTVGSHEFEKNLEQNGKQEERQAEEREKASGKLRRLHVDELGELAGLMTEEEALVAQMMADRGNSIDYTA